MGILDSLSSAELAPSENAARTEDVRRAPRRGETITREPRGTSSRWFFAFDRFVAAPYSDNAEFVFA